MRITSHLLALVLVPVIIVSAGASFYRYVVASDYVVEYEATCDPEAESCFEGCEDDACEEPYAYKEMHKYASDLRAQCGPDITDCEAANTCLPGDKECSVEYCDPVALGEDEACVEYSLEESEELTEEEIDEEAEESTVDVIDEDL